MLRPGVAVGLAALAWLLIRSATKPRRLTYPCQQAALATALGLLAQAGGFAAAALVLRRLRRELRPLRLALLLVSLGLVLGLQASVTIPPEPVLAASPSLPGWVSPGGISNVFAVTNVPAPLYSLAGGSIPSGVPPEVALRDAGVDALLNLMADHGEPFHRTASHPEGLFGPADVVVIKVNHQWDGRNGTNSDVLKGLIYALVSHPEGFTGAVLVAENPQWTNPSWYAEPPGEINSQFSDQSYTDVVGAFVGAGHRVCIADWRPLRETFVADYDAGNATSGYVLDSVDRKLSYPKFQVNCAGQTLRLSMRKGVWNGSSFDAPRLRMINLPVLKRHVGAAATIAVKNYVGFLTTYEESPGNRFPNEEGDSPHCWVVGPGYAGSTCANVPEDYGLIARQMASIRRADLDIVDAIWVNPLINYEHPEEARRQDVLMASRDPFAVDYYASEFLLGPLVHTVYPSDPGWTQAMASTHGGRFRGFLKRNAVRLRALGVTDAITLDDAWTRQQELDQFSAYVADASATVTYALTVTKDGTGRGTVTSSPAGIDCGSDCSESYDPGTVVTLAAAPAAGSTFTGWSGACTGTGACELTMDADRSVTASFSVSLSIDDVTVVEGNSGTRLATFTVTLSAPSVSSVGVDWATADQTAVAPGDYTAGSGTLAFAPGDTTKQVSVAVIGDTEDEDNETFLVTLSDATNAVIGDGQGVGTILDDENALMQPAALGLTPLGQGVLKAGDTVEVQPSWRNDGTQATAAMTGSATASNGGTLVDGAASYGVVGIGATASCAGESDCYSLTASGPRPANHWDVKLNETLSENASHEWLLHVGDSFSDVPRTSGYFRFIETLLHHSVTGGCTATTYCPGNSATRGQMAIFALVGKEGSSYAPPACGVTPMFTDVPVTSPLCKWIEELARRGVVGGCGGGNYCPANPVSRGQMPIFMLKTLDPTFDPPACTTPMFADMPATSPYCKWIEELARRGVVSGCGGGNYCPTNPVTRGQMGVFISATFGLTLYGP
jgi:hypothetical protein